MKRSTFGETSGKFPKWRGWSATNVSLGVVEAATEAEAVKKFKAKFRARLHVVTVAYNGAEPTI